MAVPYGRCRRVAALIAHWAVASSLALECGAEDSCVQAGVREQSASLIQSASLKRKVLFDKQEERDRRLPRAVQEGNLTNASLQAGSGVDSPADELSPSERGAGKVLSDKQEERGRRLPRAVQEGNLTDATLQAGSGVDSPPDELSPSERGAGKVLFDKQEERDRRLPRAVQEGNLTDATLQTGSGAGEAAGATLQAGSPPPLQPSPSGRRGSAPGPPPAARPSAEGASALMDLWGNLEYQKVAAMLHLFAAGSTELETVPVVVMLLGIVMCIVGVGAGACAFSGAKDSDRTAPSRGQTTPWKMSMLQVPSPPAARSWPQESATGLPALSPRQSNVSIGPGSPMNLSSDPLEAGPYLCPGLVVPDECECSLMVPRLSPKSSTRELTVDDASRVPVFRIAYCLPSRSEAFALSSGKQGSSQRLDQDGTRCLVLSSSADDRTVFAVCRLGLNGALTILDAQEKPFGLIRPRAGRPGFEVAARHGSQIHLGLTESNDLAATDPRGRTLALTELVPGDALRRIVRIGPFVDAGLITLAVLAIDLLENMRS